VSGAKTLVPKSIEVTLRSPILGSIQRLEACEDVRNLGLHA
jgi:hypothetical protein